MSKNILTKIFSIFITATLFFMADAMAIAPAVQQEMGQATAIPTKTLPKKPKRKVASEANSVSSNVSESEMAAAKASASNVSIQKTQKVNPLANHLSVGLLLSQANELNGASIKAGDRSLDLKMDTDTATGLLVQWDSITSNPAVNWNAGFELQSKREITALQIAEVGKVNISSNEPSFRSVLIQGGLSYSFNQQMYVLGGLNYGIITETSKGGLSKFELSPEIGYQIGAGLKIQKVNVELLQKAMNYTLKGESGNMKADGKVSLAGLNLQARYNF